MDMRRLFNSVDVHTLYYLTFFSEHRYIELFLNSTQTGKTNYGSGGGFGGSSSSSGGFGDGGFNNGGGFGGKIGTFSLKYWMSKGEMDKGNYFKNFLRVELSLANRESLSHGVYSQTYLKVRCPFWSAGF